MHRKFAGWNPETRKRIENMIIEALNNNNDKLSMNDIRDYIVKHNHLPKNKPLTHGSLRLFCRSLQLQGKIIREGKPSDRGRWTSADKAT
ncbi:hypothetical protein MUP77_01970 [Candidatus Bathyarchaeota archaeon]|nr:hypothetical protein [Candidatus Bathyarchaeota archaeon]